MENKARSAPKITYALLTLEILALVGGGVWFVLRQKSHQPEIRPPFEAVAFVGSSPITSSLVTQHSAGREVFRKSALEGSGPEEAMIGDSVDQWGDYSLVAGQTVLTALDDPKLKPVVSAVRLSPDRGQLRALSFGPGVYLEGRGDPTAKGYPLGSVVDAPGLTAVQLVRCKVEAGKTLDTLQLFHPESGKKWLVLRAYPDGSFEVLVGPEAKSQRVNGPPDAYVIVSTTWDPRPGKGYYRLAVRPVNGMPRQGKEIKYEFKDVSPASQIRLGEKLEAGAGSVGTMQVLETVVFNKETSSKDIVRIEDWIQRHYFGDVLARPPFTWAAAGHSSSWGDDASWSGEGIPGANEAVNFTAAPKGGPITITLDGNRQIKNLSFSNASPAWTIAEGSFPGARLGITDGDTTWHEDFDAVALVDETTVNFDAGVGSFSNSAVDELTIKGDGGTVNFRKTIGSRVNLGSAPDASRGMSYAIEAANVVQSRIHVGFHDNPAGAPVNGTVSTFLRVNQSQKTTVDQIRVAGGGGNEWGVLTIQNKATWDQDKGALFVGFAASNGTQNRSNGRIEIGHPGSVGNLVIGNDTAFEIGDNGGTGVVDVNNGTLTLKTGNDTRTVLIGDCGSDQAAGSGKGTLNLNAGGTIWAARNFTRTGLHVAGSGQFNFNGGLLKIGRATGNVTKDLIGPGITVTLNQGGARIDTNNNSTVLSRDLTGSGGLEKLGNGTLTLSGKNSYKGTTKVSAGVLSISGQALPASGMLQVTGGKVNLTGPANVAKLTFAGLPQVPGKWGATGSGAEHIDDEHFSGPGVLTVNGQ
jgi:autotransporter-associated beta strand protein